LLENMNDFPGENSVIVIDNCRIHKHSEIIESIIERHLCILLPPYSPDFNPIECAFSAMKYHIRRRGDGVRAAMRRDADPKEIGHWIFEALFAISPEDCRGWYKHCGYTVD
ncbi:hypothetical protein SISSUDRAFT_995598, partial [Sistotremastrum suecicum HHB10207 ss-3]